MLCSRRCCSVLWMLLFLITGFFSAAFAANPDWRAPVSTYSALPTPGLKDREVRLVKDIGLAFSWNAGKGAWRPLTLDEDRQLKARLITLGGQASFVTAGAPCQGNKLGSIVRDAAGIVLSCQKEGMGTIWKNTLVFSRLSDRIKTVEASIASCGGKKRAPILEGASGSIDNNTDQGLSKVRCPDDYPILVGGVSGYDKQTPYCYANNREECDKNYNGDLNSAPFLDAGPEASYPVVENGRPVGWAVNAGEQSVFCHFAAAYCAKP